VPEQPKLDGMAKGEEEEDEEKPEDGRSKTIQSSKFKVQGSKQNDQL
jgi:hypothetical protein